MLSFEFTKLHSEDPHRHFGYNPPRPLDELDKPITIPESHGEIKQPHYLDDAVMIGVSQQAYLIVISGMIGESNLSVGQKFEKGIELKIVSYDGDTVPANDFKTVPVIKPTDYGRSLVNWLKSADSLSNPFS